MRRQVILLLTAFVFALLLCGAVSAENTTTGGESGSGLNQTTSGNNQLVNIIIGVEVNYEFRDDAINPEIRVRDLNGTNINFTRTYNQPFEGHEVRFNYPRAVNGTKFNLSVSAPGYLTQVQQIRVFLNPANATDTNLYGSATFNMQATAAYRLGREVTARADQILNFSTADDVLAITTAGVPRLNGTTSEDSIEGILNAADGRITFGKGNLLMIRKTALDPVDFAFIVRRGNSLQVVYFRNASLNPVYTGTISKNMRRAEWNTFVRSVGGKNAFAFASLANAWNAGAPADLLRASAFHGHVCQGTISGYVMARALLRYYPPINGTSYRVIGVPGGSDDDSIMYFLAATPGKRSYMGFDTSLSGATSDMVGFIRWQDTRFNRVNNTYVAVPGSGTLIVMRYNRDENKADFQRESGITLTGDLENLKFNTWLLNKINTNPGELVTFVRELDGLTEEQFFYLLGAVTNITYPDTANVTNRNQTRFPAQIAHGLDMNFINNLNLRNATRATPGQITNIQLSYAQIKQIGINAANRAKQIFKNAGINLEKDDQDLAVLTSAGHVHLNGQTTEATWDGIYEVLGSRLSRSTLLPVHVGMWNPLWFAFVLRGTDGITMNTVYLRYNPDGTFFVGNATINNVTRQVNDIGPVALNNAGIVRNLSTNFIPDHRVWNSVQTIANAWKYDLLFDQLMVFLFHDHACPGVLPGFFITDFIFRNHPLGENESYHYMASTIFCKEDSMMYLLGISPGMGTYMSRGIPRHETDGGRKQGVLTIWNERKRIGRAIIINFQWPDVDLRGLNTEAARREARIRAFIKAHRGQLDPIVTNPHVVSAGLERLITESEFNVIRQGGTANTNVLQFVAGIPIRSLSDLMPPQANVVPTENRTDVPLQIVPTGTQGGTGFVAGAAAGPGQQPLPATPGQQPSPEGRTHEVAKATPPGGIPTGIPPIWPVAGVILVTSLIVLGYFKEGILGFLLRK